MPPINITNDGLKLPWLERLWQSIQERMHARHRISDPQIGEVERARVLADTLLTARGEASGAVVARELHACLQALDSEERFEFYRFLAAGFAPDEARLAAAARAYLEAATPEHTAALTAAADPPRQELLRRLNMSPGATATLVNMRSELWSRRREEPALEPLAIDLHHLLASWFNRGFLELRRIDWETPASILEKLIAHEAVHEIAGWEDLRRRLATDRRCFGFFHPALPGEPLIFLEVALVQGLSAAVQPLLDSAVDAATARDNEASADTAIFYSISNCQNGLRGISFGNFLIKQVVEELQAELPQLARFATLSPIPRFRLWLEQTVFDPDENSLDAEKTALQELLNVPRWWENDAACATLREPMLRWCALYLTEPGPDFDPVANFHLTNGARLECINWLGNVMPHGLEESYGLMANYLYDLNEIETHHEAFVVDEVVPRSAEVQSLLDSLPAVVKRSSRFAD